MATKPKAAKAMAPALNDKEMKKAIANVSLRPSANAAAVLLEYGATFGEQDADALILALGTQIDDVWKGDMRRCEAMLIGQAHALQSIFMNLSRRAIKQEYLKNMDTFLRLALKAQSQCRATLETLATIKNPPVVFAKQANIANGPQQVNNGIPNAVGAVSTHAGKIESERNELLEANHGQGLDSGTAGAAIGANKSMAALETIDRP